MLRFGQDTFPAVVVIDSPVRGFEELEHLDGLVAELVPHELELLNAVVEFIGLPFAEKGHPLERNVRKIEAVMADFFDLLFDEAFEQRFLLRDQSFIDFALHKC